MELTHFDGYAMLDAIEFGAQWQKEKDEKNIGDRLWYAHLKGEQETKEQMLKDAVEGKIVGGKCDLIHLKEGTSDYRSGDKVKVIIIKE